MTLQDRFDEAIFELSHGEVDSAIRRLEAILAEDPAHFEAQLSLGMAYCRQGNLPRAVEEGHKAERLQPREQLVHTNLSLFYQKLGDKEKAEHHGLQARIASWRDGGAPPGEAIGGPELKSTTAPRPPAPPRLPNMPWKKK